MRSLTRRSPVLPAVVCLASLVGCTQVPWRQPKEWLPLGDDEPQAPSAVVAVWSEVMLQHPDRPPTRGFGGRLMFFGPDGDTPLRADGSLLVYAFDENHPDPARSTPDRKYAFTAEQFAEHYSESKLGHSYSVWIPWDRAGGPKQDVGLICRFDPADGPAIVSQQARVTLPGTAPPDATGTARSTSYIEHVKPRAAPARAVAYQQALPDDRSGGQVDADPVPRMKTTTIAIPPRLGRLMPVVQPTRQGTESARPVNPAQTTGAPGETVTAGPRDPLETDENAIASTGSRSPGPASAGSPPGGRPAPASPPAQPTLGRAPWQPLREGPPSLPRSLPPWASGAGASSTSPSD